jgi:hypothetical protein
MISFGIVIGILDGESFERLVLVTLDRLEDVPADLDGMDIVFGKVVRHTGNGGMHLGASQFFG